MLRYEHRHNCIYELCTFPDILFLPSSTKYEAEYIWVSPSSKGDTYALCRWCQVDICIKSVGAKGLRDHEITGRHKQKASDQPLPPPASSTHLNK